MLELAQAIPEDQQEEWLRRQANLEEVDRLISSAMRSGDLPIWVAPIGEPERLVAPSAMVEVDHATVVSGVYRPPNDRGWLYGRPLFVKCRDWAAFVSSVQQGKMKIGPELTDSLVHAAPDPKEMRLPPTTSFVTLSEALTWVAFGVSMDRDQLHEVLNLDRFGGHIPQEALKNAAARLTLAGSGGSVGMRGKYRAKRDDDEKSLLTTTIEPIKLEDYRKFSHLDDELRHGEGLLFWRAGDGTALDYIFGSGRKDSYLHVKVNRADLLREFPPRGQSGREPEAIRWTDLDPPSLARAEQLVREAQADEWWNWPQAVAWVGERSLRNIAVIRLSAEQWKERRDYQPDVALGAERWLAQAYCSRAPDAEHDLQRAIERGAVRTLGRKAVDSPSHELKPIDWRGGKVVYNRTATLVSDANMLSEWAYDIAVNRSDLWREFPADQPGSLPFEPYGAVSSSVRKKPGPAPDPDWPAAIERVTAECIRAGYTRPLRRGEQAAIQALLLRAMAEKDKHPSDDTARKYARDVIEKLPDSSA
jgi:hypothetical protein